MIKPGCSEQVLRSEWGEVFQGFLYTLVTDWLFSVCLTGLFAGPSVALLLVETLGSGEKDG